MSLLSVPLNVHVIEALAEEPLALTDLRRAVGSPPQTTLRGNLRKLTELGVTERRRRGGFPGPVDLELTRAGQDLTEVANVLEAWLVSAPGGPMVLGSVAARSAIKALVDGWSSAIVRVLASHPLSLTELNRLIADLNYPSLERRLGAMRLSGQIEAAPSASRGTPYAVTPWLRRAVAPLAAAMRWERRHGGGASSPVGRLDIESTFLLSMPLVRVPSDAEGVCRLAAEVRGEGGKTGLAGVLVGVRDGRVVTCVARLQGNADGWVSGSPLAWLDAILDHDAEGLEIGGDGTLVMTLLDGLHGALQRERAPSEA